MSRKQTRGAKGFTFLLIGAAFVYFMLIFMLYILNGLRIFRYRKEGCSYLYDIDAHMNDMSRLMEGQVPYVIDATNYGNVSRFINHR